MTDPIDVEGLPEGIPQPTWRGTDGRIGWPDIFEYVYSPDAVCKASSPVPPLKPWPYKLVVNPARSADYQKLHASGIIYDEIHTGRAAKIFESPERKTTQ